MSHHPAHKTRPLDRYDPEFREAGRRLLRAREGPGGRETRRQAHGPLLHPCVLPGRHGISLRLAKIIIREDFPPDTCVDGAGVYVLIRADDWMAGWLDREPWARVDLEQTIRIVSVLFYGFRLGGRDDPDEIAAAIAAVVLEFPPEIG